jgi:hypothetical protein
MICERIAPDRVLVKVCVPLGRHVPRAAAD